MPRNATEDRFGSRTYTWKGEHFLSVTTVINKGVPKYLTAWAAKLVAEYAYDHRAEWGLLGREEAVVTLKGVPNAERDKAGARGSDIHAAVEAHVLGVPMPEWPESIAPSMRQVERFLLSFDPEYQATEASVYNRTYRYAGTADAWLTCRKGKLAGKPLIVDYKSGKNVYGDVALQLAAYARAEFLASPDGLSELPVPPVEGGAVLHIRPDDFAFREVEVSDRVFAHFLYAKAVARWADEIAPEVLGAPLEPDLEALLTASVAAA